MAKDEKPTLAKNVIARRKAMGFKTAAAFAEFARIPYGTLRDIEAGYSQGWAETKELIASALGCSVDELLSPVEQINNDLGRFASLLSNADLVTLHACLYLWRGSKDDLQKVHSAIRNEVAALRQHIDLIRSANG